jgi:hypothetical protein
VASEKCGRSVSSPPPIGIVGGSIVAVRLLSVSPLAYDAEVLQRSNITRRSILKREEQVFDQPAPIDK